MGVIHKQINHYQPQTREYYISKCRFYKGGDEADTLPPSDCMNAYYESCWVDFHFNEGGVDKLREFIHDYKKFGLGHFSPDDGAPIALKALIWSRWMHWGSGSETPESFRHWWKEFYLKEI